MISCNSWGVTYS